MYAVEDFYPSVISCHKNIADNNIIPIWDYKLDGLLDQVDFLISNPPFHSGFEIDFSLPFDLIKHGIDNLKQGGEIYIVGNHHINYGQFLTKHDCDCKIAAQNRSFIIWKATKG